MAAKTGSRHLEIVDAALLGAKVVKDASEVVPVLAPLKGAVGIVITILETIRGVKTNKEDWATLGKHLSIQIKGIQEDLSRCPIPHSTTLLLAVNRYEQKLEEILARVRLSASCGWVERHWRYRTDKEEIVELNRDMEITWKDFMREIAIQTHEIAHRVELSVDVIGDNSHINKLVPLLSATGEDHNPCLDGTRTTVLKPIRQWADDPSASQLWWLTDVAGAGKSTIAKQLSTEWKVRGRLGGCFFFDTNRPEATNKQWFCDTIAAQLANNQPRLGSLITEGIKELGPILNVCSFEEKLQKLVIRPMKDVALVLVIDALDECNERDRTILIRNLLSSLSQAPQLKILITSRPERDIVQLLDSYRSHTESLHDIELKSNRDDIAAFVTYKMRGLVQSSELVEEDVNRLTKRVSCLFILASTACKVVHDSPDPQTTLNELIDPKRNPLRDINSLYWTILTKVHNSDQVGKASASKSQEPLVKVLKAIVAATIPLTISTIDGLLGIKNTKRLVGFLSSVLDVRSDETVVILHPTFREFLENETVAGQFHIDMANAHKMMAKGCLEIMKQELQFNVCQLESSFVLNKDVPDLKERISRYISKALQYGCVYWPDHVLQSETSSHDSEIETAALHIAENGYLLFWMEVISVLGKVPKAINDLRDVERHKMGKELKAVINDIKRFMIGFSTPISESTPHIYVSAIAFTPKQSYLRQVAEAIFPNTMSVSIGCAENWPKPPREWLGHSSDVVCVSFSLDGHRIASGSKDKTIRLWDVETGQPLGEPFRGHSYTVRSVAFSPDGRRIVSGSTDKTVRLWDTETGETLGEPLRGHTDGVSSVAFSPDGRWVASGSDDKTIRLWDAETGQPLGESFRGHRGAVSSVAFSPDSCRIASGSTDNTIHVWSAETGQPLGEALQGHSGTVFSVAFSPDGYRIASGSRDYTIRLWDAETGETLGEPLRGHTNGVSSVAFSPDGRQIASGSWDTMIQLWDAKSGQPLGVPFRGHKDGVMSVTFSPDGLRIVSGSGDKTIRLWDARTGRPLGEPSQVPRFSSVAFSPDGSSIASGSMDEEIQLWDTETGRPLIQRFRSQPLDEQFRDHNRAVISVAFSPDGHRVASGGNTIRLWDAKRGQVSFQGHVDFVSSVAFSPDGRWIASGSWDYTIRLWVAETGETLKRPFRGHHSGVLSVAFSPDGRRIASGSWDTMIQIWDSKTGLRLRKPFWGHMGGVLSVSFSPDGLRIASGSMDNTIRLWDTETGQSLGEPFRGHSGAVRSVSFSPDGRWIASGSDDKTIRLWDAETGEPLGEPLRDHSDNVSSVGFSTDGRKIVSGSMDKTIRLWNIETGQEGPSQAIPDILSSGPIPPTSTFTFKSYQQSNGPHTLPRLFGLTSSSHFAPPDFHHCSLLEDGWVSSSGRLLYWVPPHNRYGLQHSHILLIPTTSSQRATWIDFTRFHCGTFWTKCRK